MSIFKAYDIRGVYPSEFNEQIAHDIACAFMHQFKPKKVLVGRDMRSHSPALFKAFVEGLLEQGAHVTDIGLTTTPMMYFATANYHFDAGLMITASHNPPKYNGIKMVGKDAVPIGGETGIYDLEKMMGKHIPTSPHRGTLTRFDGAKEAYIEKELSYIDQAKLKPFTLVIDTANGMGGLVAPDLFAKTPCKVIPLFFELDGTFPNHEANPAKDETLLKLKETIRENKADAGIAFDGDCDRVFMIDEHGNRIPADILAAALLPEIMRRYPNCKVLANVTCSWIVKEEVEKLGGVFGECPVGHSIIKAAMRKENSAFAIEVSGHFFFKDNHYLDSPFAIALLTLERMSETGQTLSQLVKPYKKYHSTGELNFEVQDKEETISHIEKTFSAGAKRISKIDGVKIEFDDWWFNVRPSNTEPLLRLNLEAKTRTKMEEMKQKIERIIHQ